MAAPAERFFAGRHVVPNAVRVPEGFKVEVVATGLNNPSAFDFDEGGRVFIAETSSQEDQDSEAGRIIALNEDGTTDIVSDEFDGPITGIAYYEGDFFVLEAGEIGRIHCLAFDGANRVVVDGIPGGGDNPSSDIVVAHSGRIYFAQGTRTNAGVVGIDNEWLTHHPDLCDIPSRKIILAGLNFTGTNPFGGNPLWTGAFKPFGFGNFTDEEIPSALKSTGAIFRCDPDGGGLEVVAWGLRRPIGIAVHPDGRIFCTDVGMEDRGCRRISGGGEYVWEILEDTWYGWPDYQAGVPVTEERFKPDGAPQPRFVILDHPSFPPRPVAEYPLGCGLGRFDFSRSPFFGSDGTAFLPVFGDGEKPGKIIKLDVETLSTEDFAINWEAGQSSSIGSGGMEHPLAVKFDRTGESIYILDCGIVETDGRTGRQTIPQTGVLWRIRPDEIL